ncbi:MAG TPA: hypothetical protein PLP05_10780 [Sedimentisphaerales bacterium]|nr:hypothetical protein [Sedimentisphaerales bacterium]
MDLKKKLTDYQQKHQLAVRELQKYDILVKQLEGAILACQEMIKEEEDAKKKKS